MRRYRDPNLTSHQKTDLQKDTREFIVGTSEPFFPDNRISTTKYTLANFFFKNLWEQFTKLANVYFLLLSVLQVIPDISTSHGVPTYLFPLLFIVFLTMIKDGYEDYKRYKSDQEENNKETKVLRNGRFETSTWQQVHVGDVLKVEKNEFFPADLIHLSTSHYRKGQCFIETKNLDGETNLKSKFVPDDLKGKLNSEDDVSLT